MDDAVHSINEQAGPTGIQQDDPGFTQFDPLKQPGRKAVAEIVYREIPFINLQSYWTVAAVQGALQTNLNGIFETVSQLWESIRGDDRVTATLGSRTAGLFGREVRHTPANDSKAAKEVCDAWAEDWPNFAAGPALRTISEYEIGLGWAPAQLVWDTTSRWKPRAQFWNNRYTYYHWPLRRFVALTQDGQTPIEPGDGKWLLHSHYDPYRAWIFGAVRAVAEPWLLRHFAFRDMARYSEVHGLPIRVAETPASADPDERAQYAQNVSTLGTETTLLLAKGVDEQNSYGFKLVEATDPSWEVFSALIGQCDMAIVLALNFQNLTTEVNTGSFAAVQGHMDIRQNGIQSDDMAWSNTIHRQVQRPYALFNFGDPDLAPTTHWDVTPLDQLNSKVERLQKFGTAIEVLRRGGWEFEDEEMAREWASKSLGFQGIPKFKITDPVSSGMGGNKDPMPFAPLDPTQIVKVNEARAEKNLPPIPGGDVTIADFHADKDTEREKDVTDAANKSKAENAPPPAPHAEPDGDEGDNLKEAAE
jgi:phage gp29-like protein